MSELKHKTVIRVIVVGNQTGDWFGLQGTDENPGSDRHNVGELLQVLEHATHAIQFHSPNGREIDKYVFDILPPPWVKTREQNEVWALQESERMQSFGYNAVPAPEWKE